jgi:DNA (cytosine-5)-methyltransferase 1
MTYGSLFSGCGGMDLGLERAGMTCVWQVENDPYAQKVLQKHWPDVRRHDDVRTFPPEGEWGCDLIAGGFPCQDISLAGRGVGIGGERSGLWFEFARILRVLRPRFAIVENSAALANRGLWAVLGTLAELGFDAEWAVLPASAFGACHIRARMFIVAHRQRGRRDGLHERQQTRRLASDPGDGRPDGADRTPAVYSSRDDADDAGQGSPDGPSETNRRGSTAKESQQCRRGRPGRAINAADPDRPSRAVREEQIMLVQQPAPIGSGWWAAEPDVVRVVHGFPGRVDRIRCLGNAVVPQVAEWIGRRLMEATQTEGV